MNGLTVRGHHIPESELEESFTTSGGPGGQHANRTESAVTLRFAVTRSGLPEEVKSVVSSKLGDIVEVVASDSRSQWRNRVTARQRLAVRLDAAMSIDNPRRETQPSRAARERRLNAKRARSELKRSRQRPDID